VRVRNDREHGEVKYRPWALTNGIYEIAERGRKSAPWMSQAGQIIRRLLGEAGKRSAVRDEQTRKCRPESEC
jgi:hypothetical protein